MPNKVYINPETAVTFAPSGGNVAFTVTSLANNAGRISAQWDRGSGAKPARYVWRAKTKASAALTAGTALDIFMSTSNGSIQDGNLGTSDAAISSVEKMNNLRGCGAIIADSTTSGEPLQSSGIVTIYDRYVSVVWWNRLGQALTGTASDHAFVLTPVPDEIQ